MQGLYAKMLWADAMVIGTPVYWWGPSAQTKLFVDRWYAFDNKREAFHGKPFAVLTPSGSGSSSMADYVFGMFRSIASYLGMPLIGTQWAAGRPLGRMASDSRSAEQAFELGRCVAAACPSRAHKGEGASYEEAGRLTP